MKQIFVFATFLFALATAFATATPAMAQTTVPAFPTSTECQAAQQAQPALEYVPFGTAQHKSDDAAFTLEEGQCYFMNVPEKISFLGMEKGWAWVPVQSGTEMLKDKNGRIRHGKCRNLTNGFVPFLAPKSSQHDFKQDSELAVAVATGLAEAEKLQAERDRAQKGPGNCAMVLAAQRQQYAGDLRKKSVAIECEDHDGKIVVTASDFKPAKTASSGGCGFLCRLLTEPAYPGYVPVVYGYGGGVNTYYGGGYGGGYVPHSNGGGQNGTYGGGGVNTGSAH